MRLIEQYLAIVSVVNFITFPSKPRHIKSYETSEIGCNNHTILFSPPFLR